MRKIVVAVSLVASVALAEQNPNEQNLKEVKLQTSVVTGSAYASDVMQIPGSISVVDSKQIHAQNNQKIADTIKKLQGVRVGNDAGFNPRPRITIRGINYGTLLMLDGVVLSDLEGEARIINQIALYDVERVEVARGAFSSLYGAGAIGGVINFITSMPNKFSTDLIIGYGNEVKKDTADKNLFRIYANIGDAFLNNRLRVKLSGMYVTNTQSSNYPTTYGESSAPNSGVSGFYQDKAGKYILGTGGDRKYQIFDTRLKAELDTTQDSMLSASLSYSSYSYTFGNFKSYLKDSSGNPTNLISNKDYFVGSGYGGMGTYSHLVGNVSHITYFDASSFKVSASSVNLFSIWQDATQGTGDRFGGVGGTQDTDSSSNYLDFLYNLDISQTHKLALATQFRYYTYKQAQRNMTNWLDSSTRAGIDKLMKQKAFVGSVYASLDSAWSEYFSSTIGARYDYWNNFNGYYYNSSDTTGQKANDIKASIISPKLGISFTPTSNLAFKSSLGYGFRMPTMRDMYRFTHGRTHWNINTQLKREDAISFDIGAEYAGDFINASLFYYQTELFNMIYTTGDGSSSSAYQNINAGRGRINGIESALSLNFTQNLNLSANYTLTMATILKNETNPATNGHYIGGVPKHMANVSLNYMPNYGFYGSLWAYYVPAFFSSDKNTPVLTHTFGEYETQFNLNAKLGYNFKSGIDVSLSGFNITNNRYYDYYQVPGASIYGQIRFKI